MKWGEKKPEREEKEEEERSGRKIRPGLNGRKLGASHLPHSLRALAPRRVSSAPASMTPS